MIVNGTLEVRESFPLIGSFPKVFAWVLFSISIIGILLVAFPFYAQAIPEFNKIAWADFKTSIDAIIKVFIFVILFALIFTGFDYLIQLVIGSL